jgi:hypothetical protein
MKQDPYSAEFWSSWSSSSSGGHLPRKQFTFPFFQHATLSDLDLDLYFYMYFHSLFNPTALLLAHPDAAWSKVERR